MPYTPITETPIDLTTAQLESLSDQILRYIHKPRVQKIQNDQHIFDQASDCSLIWVIDETVKVTIRPNGEVIP